MTPNKQNLQKLVDALRSGKYKQGKQALRNGDSYCCLGVACDIVDPTKWETSTSLDSKKQQVFKYNFSQIDQDGTVKKVDKSHLYPSGEFMEEHYGISCGMISGDIMVTLTDTESDAYFTKQQASERYTIEYKNKPIRASQLNDLKFTFDEIATIIERNYLAENN